MNIAYTIAPGRGDTDLLLAGVAARLAACGVKAAGTVQINTDRETCHACDMDVRVLPDGPVIRISQDLGKASRGCRLDPEALEQAVAQVQTNLGTGVDLLIVNKFGKHEAEGRGFRPVIAEALELGLPVLVGLNTLNQAAFMEFTADLGEALPPEEAALVDWVKAHLAAEAA
jgi:nucleoside-triphosphatase THEP1